MAITFTYNSEKIHMPFAQNLASQNSKEKYKSRKILDFARKNENN
jgi:hypothetical protein